MTENNASNIQQESQKNYPRLQLLGQELLNKFRLAEVRRKFQFDVDIIREASDREIYEFVNYKLAEWFKSTKLQGDIDIIHREFAVDGEKAGLGWHIDDCQLVHKKQPPTFSSERFIHLFDDRWLYISGARSRIPRWTIILYLSTEGPNMDFQGGWLRLADGTEYRPVAGLGILIDSREVHMVTPVRSGKRKSIVIKIY